MAGCGFHGLSDDWMRDRQGIEVGQLLYRMESFLCSLVGHRQDILFDRSSQSFTAIASGIGECAVPNSPLV